MPPEIIDTAMARQLIGAHAIHSAAIIGRTGGWSVLLRWFREQVAQGLEALDAGDIVTEAGSNAE